jgi:hypothetical protein
VWPTSLLNSGRPWNSILAMEAGWVMLILVFVSPSSHFGQYLKIGHKSCLCTKQNFIFQEGIRNWNYIMLYWEYFLHIFVK